MKKLYEKNSYLKENITVVTECVENNEGIFISLEETIFFPEEGGQYADTGMIYVIGNNKEEVGILLAEEKDFSAEKSDLRTCDSMERSDIDIVRVLDGQLEGKDNILYKVDKKIPVGSRVRCVLDYDFRYEKMQNHSGEHILTGVIHNTYGYTNKGFHLGNEGAITLDVSNPMTYEEVMEMEKRANEIIYLNLPISDSYPTEEELKNIEYRSKIEIDGQVRLITIGTEDNIIDICACCAPHVGCTGEVGIIKVTDIVNWKGGVRIFMVAGRRALEYINNEHNIIRKLKEVLSTSPENFPELVGSYVKELSEIKFKLNKQYENNIIERLEREIEAYAKAGAENTESKELNKNHFEFVATDFPSASMKNIYNILVEKFSGFVGIFAGDDENGYRYMAGNKAGKSKLIFAVLSERFACKGGGNDKMVQGQLQGKKEDILEVLNILD